MIVQIYEIQSAEEARDVAAAGVDHIGLLVGEGDFPREISPDRAIQILAAIPQPAKKLVLTLSRDLNAIVKMAGELRPDILHLGTLSEWLTPTDVKYLKREWKEIKIMRSIPVTDHPAIETARAYDGIADFLLLDTHKEEDTQIGATGAVHDWNISKKIVQAVKIPVILAGGLGPENVAEAIQRVQPAGVDSKTKTDQPGTHRKDLTLVRKFVSAARAS
jgi:phosphoribosylanthranilate isomerase